MMLLRLSFFLALCAMAFGHTNPSYGCAAKKVLYGHYNNYNYKYPSNYPASGHYGKRCDNVHYAYDAHGYCSAYGYGYGHNYGYYHKCYARYCYLDVYYGKSSCHGYVKLSKIYYYLYAKECSNAGRYCNYGGHGGSYKNCACHTKVCSTKIKACYSYGGYYYEDYVTVQVPCGCSCYKKLYRPKRSFPYFGIAVVIKGKHY
ncbi:uncharacterized protein LOC120339536 [Styela clava]